MLFGLRFDFRNPAISETTMADRYAAALDMAEWADRLGCLTIAISEPLNPVSHNGRVTKDVRQGKAR